MRRSVAICVEVLAIVSTIGVIITVGNSSNWNRPAELPIVRVEPTGNLRLGSWLFMPPSGQSVGAVILLHGCNGLDDYGWRHAVAWAQRLNRDGYAALILDSFTSRGLRNICGQGEVLPPDERVGDIYVAADRLAVLPGIKADNIVAMGFSHGAWTALHAAYEPNALQHHLSAVIAFYPACRDVLGKAPVLPGLILIGSLDDWTPAQPCEALVAQDTTQGAKLQIRVFNGARHSFDVKRFARTYLGHRLAFDEEADRTSQIDVEAFLSAKAR